MILRASKSQNLLRKRRPKCLTITLLGDSGVGKSCIALQACCSQFIKSYDPTIEESFAHTVIVDDERHDLELLDGSGIREYYALQDERVRRADGYVIVYSITSRSSFDYMAALHAQIRSVRECRIPAGLDKASAEQWKTGPIILVGTKNDLESDRIVSKQEGHDLAKILGCQFAEITAKSHDQVSTVLSDTVRMVVNFRLKLDPGRSGPEAETHCSSKTTCTGGCKSWARKHIHLFSFMKRSHRTAKTSAAPIGLNPGSN
ncbi:P-loop containing nucleoside triphosphate hydrolase protein [Dactylonectria estremocensis]|uniref:P-loop containing nucleoside triphosphate hydrolase protein n=1 Tax=Dactylonectria estremocensis TaxID=1079267 RepID=A0A9P9J5K3_9HYPO|nr:P-loop containing nucleoside triphosphate hydrolase protein [Dactylonectria estremocensis]